jgi:hypothetical protein
VTGGADDCRPRARRGRARRSISPRPKSAPGGTHEVKARADRRVEIINMARRVAGYNSGAGTVAKAVEEGVLYRCASDAALLIAGIQQFWRAAMG